MFKVSYLYSIILLAVLLSGGNQGLIAQSSLQLKNKAEYLLRQGFVYEALPLLEKYCIKKPKDSKSALLLADKYQEVRDYHKASDWYWFVYQSDTVKYHEALFQYGKLQKMVGAYQNAYDALNQFNQSYKGRGINRDLKKQVEIEIAGCLMADSLYKNPADVIIRLLDTTINKIYSEFSPLMIDDSTLIYAGMEANEIVYSDNRLPIKQFMHARKVNEKWIGRGPWDFIPQGDNEIIGNGIFSQDKKRFYFTRCSKSLNSEVICQIYLAKMQSGQWTEPDRLGSAINLPNYTSTHPAVGAEPGNTKKEILYFVSNRPDGEGGYDLYYSVYSIGKDEFSEARNIGRKINTSGDEYTVHVDPNNNKMYFSSNGWPGIGGFDIFSSSGSKREWTQPENIGVPFNSNADDLYFSSGTNRMEGLFVSNRSGGVSFQDFSCCDDIYSFKWKKYININVKGSIAQTVGENMLDLLPSMINPRVKLLIMDKSTGEYILASEKAILSDTFSVDLETEEIYRILVEAENYTPKSFDVSTRNYVLSDTLNLRFAMEVKPEMPIILDDILFDFDSSVLNENSRQFLDQRLIPVMQDKKGMHIEISAHTDNRGDDRYNLALSQKRAESVRNYLISKGIASTRIEAIGFGESRPIVSNENDDGSDNEEGRARNRRVELRILK
jgi:OmpA-OmpF porin, OOP family